MKALQIVRPGKMHLIEKPIPEIETETQVLIKITAAGICGSDIHIIHGRHPFITYPRVFGHEGCGEVAAMGSAVTGFQKGDPVVIEPIRGCGKCYACRHGKYNACPEIEVLGVHKDGLFSEYVVVDQSQLHPYSRDLKPYQAATAEPFTVGAQANARADTQPDDLVLIHGAGPIGLVIADVALSRGARVIMSDPIESRRKIAMDFGCEYTIDPSKEDVDSFVRTISHGEGINVAFDTTGIPKLYEESIRLLSAGGRFVPLALENPSIQINFSLVTKNELSICGSRNQNDKFREIVSTLPSRVAHIDRYVTHLLPLEEYEKAFALCEDRNSGACKIVFVF